jgi:signal transduction histidine kinase
MVHTSPIKNKNNEVELVLEMAADIRAVKRLKEELHATQRKYQQLFDEAPCYIYVQDRQFRLTAINKRFKEDFGDETGSHCYRVYKDRKKPCNNCPLEQTYRDGKMHQAEMVMTSKTGEKFTVVLWTAPIKNDVGEVVQVMVMATNITQIRELQDHLASLGLMIGSISHGAKGLLTGLDAGIYMMDAGFEKKDQDQIDEGWEIIKLMTSRIRSLVLDILYYAKERELKWEKVDVLSFAKDVELVISLKIRSQRIHFRCDFDDSLGEFEVDAGIVHSALINILENAMEACLEDTSKESHTISFSVTQDKDTIIFDVTDNGLGMDEATRKNMFNIFFSSKGKKGTGLGLYLSNKIIQQHGGSIEVKSDPGMGSQFRINMPKMLPESIKTSQHT